MDGFGIALLLFDLLNFLVKIFNRPVGICIFSDILYGMANNQFQDVLIHICGFCHGDERVPGIVRLMVHVQSFHYFVEPPPVFIIGQECTLLAVFIIEEVIAAHLPCLVIIFLYQFPDPWVDGDNPVLSGIRFQATDDSPAIQINVIYLQYSKLLGAESRVYANQYHICERYLDIVP